MSKEITVEFTSVNGVNKENFDAIVKKVEELFGPKMTEVCGGLMDSVWPPDLPPEKQKERLEEEDEIELFFMKVRD